QLAKELCVFPFSYWPIPIPSDLFRISSFGFRISGSAGLRSPWLNCSVLFYPCHPCHPWFLNCRI
ncbi:MAG: hypothetical protein WCQ21_27015, partial [Verrucomicrobiota bacterium]